MAWLPTRSLFGRAFLTFWGAMAVILVCGMVLTAAVAWYRFNSLDGLNPAISRAMLRRSPAARAWMAWNAGSKPWTGATRR